jgi:hypothetical protein
MLSILGSEGGDFLLSSSPTFSLSAMRLSTDEQGLAKLVVGRGRSTSGLGWEAPKTSIGLAHVEWVVGTDDEDGNRVGMALGR